METLNKMLEDFKTRKQNFRKKILRKEGYKMEEKIEMEEEEQHFQ